MAAVIGGDDLLRRLKLLYVGWKGAMLKTHRMTAWKAAASATVTTTIAVPPGNSRRHMPNQCQG